LWHLTSVVVPSWAKSIPIRSTWLEAESVWWWNKLSIRLKSFLYSTKCVIKNPYHEELFICCCSRTTLVNLGLCRLVYSNSNIKKWHLATTENSTEWKKSKLVQPYLTFFLWLDRCAWKELDPRG
jgi:hypothetical protein